MASIDKLASQIVLKLGVEADGYATRIRQMMRSWAAAGLSEEAIMDKLLKELRPGGSVFESLVKGFSNATGETVDLITIEEVHDQWEGPDEWIWITVTDENRCDDCKERHGQVKTYEEWEALGLPGAGATVCQWRCRCTLEPKEYAEGVSLEDVLIG